MLVPYLQVFRARGLALPLLASFAGALPIAMLNLSVLLLVRLHGQSFTTAGAVAAALSLGSCLGLIGQGASIDRCGPAPVLATAAVTCAVSLTALVANITGRGPNWLTAVLAFVCGASIPATPTAARALCATLIIEPRLQMTAYAMLAMASTAAALLGPLLVSLLLAAGATSAVLATAALAAGTGIAYALTPAARRRPLPADPPRWPLPSLTTPGMRTLAVVSTANGAILGLLSVAIPAAALARHNPALAGGLFAVSAAGDLAGGLVYGSRSWHPSLHTRLVAMLLAVAGSCAALGILTSTLAGLAAAMTVFGAAEAATGITLTALVHHAAPPHARTESYAVIISASLLGTAAGNLISGTLVTDVGLRLAFTTAAATALGAAAWAGAHKQMLQPTSEDPTE